MSARRGQHVVVASLGVALLLGGCSTSPAPTATATPTPPAPTATATAVPPVTRAATVCTVPARLAGRDVERLPVARRVVALTFDGGANADGARPVLDVMAARHVPGTFFLTGGFVRSFPHRARRIGVNHLVGNHTLTHADLTTLTDLQVRAEVRRAEAAIRSVTGQDPRRFLRFPYGARDARVIRVANRLCYVPFRWTVDSLGWKGSSGGQSAQAVADRVVAAARPGAIVLMHLGSNPDDGTLLDAAALPQVIRRLRQAGYRFVSLSAVLDAAP